MKLDLLKPLRLLAALTALLPFAAGNAAETSADGLTLGPADSRNVLVVHASNSVQVFRGVLEDFSRLNPGLRLEYTELSTQELYAGTVSRATQAPATRSGPDIVISSAMDLQTKLVNDGYAQPHISPETRALPAWANWRDEVFSIGTDPIVMVYNTSKLASARAPRTRRELLSLLQAPDQPLAGAISTYDVEGSGIGYLAATQDTRLDSMAGALLAELGRNRVAVHASTEDALDKLERGEITLAYNLLESYTRHRIDLGAPLAIVYPQDYTLMLSRSAIDVPGLSAVAAGPGNGRAAIGHAARERIGQPGSGRAAGGAGRRTVGVSGCTQEAAFPGSVARGGPSARRRPPLTRSPRPHWYTQPGTPRPPLNPDPFCPDNAPIFLSAPGFCEDNFLVAAPRQSRPASLSHAGKSPPRSAPPIWPEPPLQRSVIRDSVCV
jgi:iron(III) transport system substrate-binding protein